MRDAGARANDRIVDTEFLGRRDQKPKSIGSG